ncbi:MAG: hypothetical protein P8X57_15550 [Cyclobacteriaceae bacterium]
MKDIVHLYYKRTFPEYTILVQVNPVDYTGIELTVLADGSVEKRELQFDEEIEADLETDDFRPSSPLEFNIYLKGLRGSTPL